MNELFGLAISFLALVISWKFWKRTIRDSVRDDLFDVRDEWRSYWISHGLDLANPSYAKFRSEINCYLRFTSTYRFSDILYVAQNSKRIKSALGTERDSNIRLNQETLDFMRNLNGRAFTCLQAYMVLTSILIIPTLALVPVFACVKRISIAVSFARSTVKLAQTTPYFRPELIRQAAHLNPFPNRAVA